MDSRTKTASSNSRVGEQTEQTSIEAHQEKIIPIELKKYSLGSDGVVRAHVTYYERAYESQAPKLIEAARQDSLDKLPKNNKR